MFVQLAVTWRHAGLQLQVFSLKITWPLDGHIVELGCSSPFFLFHASLWLLPWCIVLRFAELRNQFPRKVFSPYQTCYYCSIRDDVSGYSGLSKLDVLRKTTVLRLDT